MSFSEKREDESPEPTVDAFASKQVAPVGGDAGVAALPPRLHSTGAEEPLPPSYGPLHPIVVWSRLKRDKPALFGLSLVLIFVVIAFFAPLLSPANPDERHLDQINEPPKYVKLQYERESGAAGEQRNTWAGRDVRGRDVLSRVIYGARISLLVGLAVASLAAFIGVTLGCVAGYAGGILDTLIMRLVDMLLAFPTLILALAIVSIFEHVSVWHIALVLGLSGWPGICRLMRGQVLSTRENDYVKAAQALGASHFGVLARHVLPNCIAPVVIWFMLGLAGAIMSEASLSFIGIGDPDSLSWGTMINSGMFKSNFPAEWWTVTFPAAALALLVLGFNLLGDGLQDAINPKLKH